MTGLLVEPRPIVRPDLVDLATKARAFLEPRWKEWKAERSVPDDIASLGMCRFSAIFLVEILNEGTSGLWLVDGGIADPDPDDENLNHRVGPGGFIAQGGACHSHYWCVDAMSRLIVDVTADQFDGPEIVVTELGDPRYRRNILDDAIELHLEDARTRAEAWFEEWKTEIGMSRIAGARSSFRPDA